MSFKYVPSRTSHEHVVAELEITAAGIAVSVQKIYALVGGGLYKFADTTTTTLFCRDQKFYHPGHYTCLL